MNEHPHISEKLTLKPGLTLQRFSQTFVLFSGSLLFSCLNGIPATQAQIIPDATLPVNSTVTPQGNINQINGGTQAGGNLFHSFQEFSIPTGNEAFFNNSLDIQNIFSRVTGNSISNIDGLIRANGFANLFLLNPNGIVFGPNAQLNLGGSFLASTANRINFADGTAFTTVPSETPPLLTVSVPIGLQMGVNPGKIVVQGPGIGISFEAILELLSRTNDPFDLDLQNDPLVLGLQNQPTGLEVQEQTLALVSSEIELDGGKLSSRGGRLELGSVGDNSTVSLQPTDKGWELGYSEVTDFRDILINNASSLNASGEGGGRIQIQAQNLYLREGSNILSLTEGNRIGQDLTIRATGNIELSGYNSLWLPSQIGTGVSVGATNNAGNITLEASNLTLADGANISSFSQGQGPGGDLNIQANGRNLNILARESVSLSGFNSVGTPSNLGSIVGLGSGGDAGNITIETDQLTLNDGSLISSSTLSRGNAGNLNVETGQLTLNDGAIISTSTFGQGNGGALIVRATESVTLSGLRGDGFGSSVETVVREGAIGDAGNLTIETAQLTLNDGAVISSSTLGQGKAGDLNIRATESVTLSGLRGDGFGSSVGTIVGEGAIGDAGNLTIETSQLNLNDGAVISSGTAGQGNGGDLNIRARESLTVRGLNAFEVPSILTTTVFPGATGDAGNITVETAQFTLNDGAIISSSTLGQGNGGALNIRAHEFVNLSGVSGPGIGSQLQSGVGPEATGHAGKVTIETAQLTLNDGATISSVSKGYGNAGDLNILASEFIMLRGIDALGNSSGFEADVNREAIANAGNITVETTQLTLSEGASISSSNLGQGNSGSLTIRATEFVKLSGVDTFFGNSSSLQTVVGPLSSGDGGSITVETTNLSLTDGASIGTTNLGEGNAGNLNIFASESVTLSGSNTLGANSLFQTVYMGESIGSSGSITIETKYLELLDGASISTDIFGEGNAGDLNIRASESVTLSGLNLWGQTSSLSSGVSSINPFSPRAIAVLKTLEERLGSYIELFSDFMPGLSTLRFGTGEAGNITIETARLNILDGAIISTSTQGQGGGGSLTIFASESVVLSGSGSAEFPFSFLTTGVEEGAIGNGGDLIIDTGRLVLLDGSFIVTTSLGQGNSGDLIIRASEFVSLSGQNAIGIGSRLSTEVLSTSGIMWELIDFNELPLSVIMESLLEQDLDPLNFAIGNAGSITVETPQVILSDGASISSSTGGQGNAGTISIRASESVTLDGLDDFGNGSSLLTVVAPGATGDAGSLTIETGQLTLTDGARISSETFADGNAGDVTVRADEVTLRDGAQISVSAIGDFSPGVLRVNTDRLFLENQSSITAETESGSQGNIEISASSLIMRRNSNITTNATGPATGGNINITTEVLAALENSNINANSEQAQGGTVTIDAQAIFGTEFRESPTSNSDITATGADSSLSGTVSINTPEIDPTSGLVELPTTLTDVAQQIDSSCRPGQQQSEFIVTGRGGLPPNPIEAISDEATWLDLRPGIAGVLSGGNGPTSSVADASNPVVSSPTPPLVEAQGWVVNAQGKMELVAQGSEVTLQNRTVTPSACLAN